MICLRESCVHSNTCYGECDSDDPNGLCSHYRLKKPISTESAVVPDLKDGWRKNDE